MPVICISRQYGAGGKTVGEMVAKRLGYQFFDHAILAEVAQEANLSIQWVERADRDAGDKLMRLVSKILANKNFIQYLPGTKTKFDEKKYRSFLRAAITKIGKSGRAVILGRGAQFILRDNPDALRIMLLAEDQDRINSLKKRYALKRSQAETIAHIDEGNRLNFLRAFEAGDPEDHHLYHLVINTSLVSYETAAGLICQLAG